MIFIITKLILTVRLRPGQGEAGLELQMKNNQKGLNFNFLRDDSKFI